MSLPPCYVAAKPQIDDCKARSWRLNSWEKTFIEDLEDKLRRGIIPTSKQVEKLDETWEKAMRNG